MNKEGLASLLPVTDILLQRSQAGLAVVTGRIAHLAGLIDELSVARPGELDCAGDLAAVRNAESFDRWKVARRKQLEGLLAVANAERAGLLAETGRNFARHDMLRSRLQSMQQEAKQAAAKRSNRSNGIAGD